MIQIIDKKLQFNSNYSNMGNVEGIVLHHSGTKVLQSVETIHNYHKSKGWAGIGYHYYVRKDGTIYKGRPENMAGAHCPGANSKSIGICAEGDFNTETMSEIQIQAIRELIADIKARRNIKYVKGHRDIIATSCPGKNYPFNEVVSNLPDLQYQVHLQDLGWQNVQNAGEGAGTEGQDRRLEAVKFFANNGLTIKYRAHVGEVGWQDWKNSGEIAGTTGESKRIEALEIKCNKLLEVQEHIQDVGWMPKTTAKEFTIGTVGKSLRMEAFRMKVIG